MFFFVTEGVAAWFTPSKISAKPATCVQCASLPDLFHLVIFFEILCEITLCIWCQLHSQYAVKAQTSLAPLARFRGSLVTSAHAHQYSRFQTYAKTVPLRMKLTSEIDKA